jgi:hypothetical protein
MVMHSRFVFSIRTWLSFKVVLEEARVVRDIFWWVGVEHCILSEVRRRLRAAGVPTRTGTAWWSHKTIWDLLQNPAYKGEAAYSKTRSGPLEPRWRAPRGRPDQSRRGSSPKSVPVAHWIVIPVPALVDASLIAVVQAQLAENRRRARIPPEGQPLPLARLDDRLRALRICLLRALQRCAQRLEPLQYLRRLALRWHAAVYQL